MKTITGKLIGLLAMILLLLPAAAGAKDAPFIFGPTLLSSIAIHSEV